MNSSAKAEAYEFVYAIISVRYLTIVQRHRVVSRAQRYANKLEYARIQDLS